MKTLYITSELRGAFYSALGDADKGDRIVYHIGEHCGGPHRKDASDASDRNACFLFCRRLGEGVFEYLAVKR